MTEKMVELIVWGAVLIAAFAFSAFWLYLIFKNER